MKIRLSLKNCLVGAVILILAAGCTHEPLPTTFVLDSTSVEIPCEGATAKVTYTLENPADDTKIVVKAERDWVYDINIDVPGEISFKVDENPQFQTRTCRVDVICLPDNISQSFTVTQELTEPYVYKITITDLQPSMVNVTVKSATPDIPYLIKLVTKADYEKFGATPEALYEVLRGQYEYYCYMYGCDLYQFYEKSGHWHSGLTEAQYPVDPGNDYYIFAVGMDPHTGDQTTELVLEPFTTPLFDKRDVSFDIKASVEDGIEVNLRIKPSDDNVLYYYCIVNKASYASYGEDYNRIAQTVINSEINSIMYDGCTKEEAVESLLIKGELDKSIIQGQNYNYYALAFTVTGDGYVDSDVAVAEFSTGDVPPSDNTFKITLEDAGIDSITYDVKTTNDDQYIMIIEPASNWEGKSDEQIKTAIAKYTLSKYKDRIYNGNIHGTKTELIPDTDYIVIICGFEVPVSKAAVTTDIFKSEFRTLASPSADDFTFESDFKTVSDRAMRVSIAGTPDGVLYFWGICPKDYDEGRIFTDVDILVQEQISNKFTTGIQDKAMFMRRFGSRGTSEKFFEALYSETEYKVYAFAVNPEDGEPCSDVIYGDVTKTKKATTANVSIDIDYKYFDGFELALIDSGFMGASGGTMLQADVTVTGNPDNYYFSVMADDLTSPSVLTDDDAIVHLYYNGEDNEWSSRLFALDYDKTYTILGVAKTKDGQFGPVFREKIILTKDGVTPIDEFDDPTRSATSKAQPYAKTGTANDNVASTNGFLK